MRRWEKWDQKQRERKLRVVTFRHCRHIGRLKHWADCSTLKSGGSFQPMDFSGAKAASLVIVVDGVAGRPWTVAIDARIMVVRGDLLTIREKPLILGIPTL